ncbi:radical SAM protein [Campylobacter coli]|nr:radical SAM protein [Campylobacter coli]
MSKDSRYTKVKKAPKMISDEDFAEFFQAAIDSNLNEDFKRPLIESKYKLKSNILYLTDACNFDCDYCYQKNDRDRLTKNTYITESEINEFFKDLIKREPDKPSTVVIFGGEPFLNPDIVYYIFDLTDKITYHTNKRFNLSLTTNGAHFKNTKNADYFIERTRKLLNHFSLEISYDLSGNSRRVYRNGKDSTKDTEFVLSYFKSKDYKLTIRYTVHKLNYMNALKDLITLSLDSNYKKIVVNFYETELEQYINVSEFKETLKRQTCEVFKRTKMPICHLNCLACMGCNFADFDGIYYQYNDKSFEVQENAKIFESFTEYSAQNK